MEFECVYDATGLRSTMKMGGVTMDTATQVIFAPARIDDDSFQLWTQPWKQPYQVMSVLYLTAPSIQYLIVNDSGLQAEHLYSLLPANITKQLIEATDVQTYPDNNYRHTVLIVFDQTHLSTFPNAIDSKELSRIYIQGPIERLGNVIFYKKDAFGNFFVETGNYSFLGSALALGAVYTADADTFNCSIVKLLNRYSYVNSLHLLRAQELEDGATSCRSTLDVAVGTLELLKTAITQRDFVTIYNQGRVLKRSNEDLLRGSQCPIIY